MKITRLRVTNYRGIEALETKIPERGLVVKGTNGGGKTSVLGAIRAALAGLDVGPDAIRIGTDRSEILVDLDHLTVKRIITPKRSTVSVEGSDAKPIKSPQTWLNDILGTAPIDPIELYLEKPAKRRAVVLSALPLRVTPEQVATWVEDFKLDAKLDYSLHGLEVVDQIRKEFYTRRTEANATAKEITKEVEALEAGAPPAVPGAIAEDEAHARFAAAGQARGALDARRDRIAAHEARTKETRERAKQLRGEADAITANDTTSPDPHAVEKQAREVESWRGLLAKADEDVVVLEKQLEDLQRDLAKRRTEAKEARAAYDGWLAEGRKIEEARAARASELARAKEMVDQATSLEAAIAATAETMPTEEETAAADAEIVKAEAVLDAARAAKLRAEHEAKVADARTRHAKAEEDAGRLNYMVDKFTKEIPNELLKASHGIPGLSLEDDDVFLDGVRISKLSGREQLLFAVEIARRLNVRAKILIVDGLERIEPDLLPEFLTRATAGGYQLIATRADRGDVVLEAIEPDDTETTEAKS